MPWFIPFSTAEVSSLIELAREKQWSLVPFGGGSSVVGGVEASDERKRPVVTLDTTRLEGLVSLDLQSRTATFGAGTYGPAIERELNPLGWSLGHYPQSFEFSTLGGWIAARSAGQQSNQYGRIEDLLVSCRMVSPAGELVTWNGPASAAGPDLKGLIAGSEGTLGVITEATVAIHPVPEYHRIQAVMFKTFEQGKEAVRDIVQAGLKPSFMRLSDEGETLFYLDLTGTEGIKGLGLDVLAAMGYGKSKSVLLVGTEGERKAVHREVASCVSICKTAQRSEPGNLPREKLASRPLPSSVSARRSVGPGHCYRNVGNLRDLGPNPSADPCREKGDSPDVGKNRAKMHRYGAFVSFVCCGKLCLFHLHVPTGCQRPGRAMVADQKSRFRCAGEAWRNDQSPPRCRSGSPRLDGRRKKARWVFLPCETCNSISIPKA